MRPILSRVRKTLWRWTAPWRAGAAVVVASMVTIGVAPAAWSAKQPLITISANTLLLGADGRGSVPAKIAVPVAFGPGTLILENAFVGSVSERLKLEAKNDQITAAPVEGAPPWPKAGKYSATLIVRPEGSADANEQKLALEISVTAPDVALPEKVTVRCAAGPFSSANCECERISAPDKLTLSPIRPVSGVSFVATAPSGGQSSGQIGIESDGSITAKNFEVGTVSGKLLLRVGRVGAAATLPFEVQTRVTPVWLWVPLMILLGISAGYIVRRALDTKATFYERKAFAIRLVQQIQQTDMYKNDPEERERLDNGILANIQKALDANESSAPHVETLTTALASAQKDLDGIGARRAQESSAFDSRVAVLKDLLDRYWVLPEAVATIVCDAQASVATATKKANAENLSGARAELDGLDDDLPKRLDQAISEWLADLGAGCPRIPGLPLGGADEFEVARAAIPLGLPRPAPLVILEGTHKAYRLGLATTTATARAIGALADQVDASQSLGVAELRTRFRRTWSEAGGNLLKRCEVLRTDGVALWKAVQPSVGEGRESLFRQVARSRATELDIVALIESSAAKASAEGPARGAAALPEVGRFERRALFIRHVQTLLGGALVVASGTALLAPKFFGTWEDFVSVVAWGFTADVTLQKVVEFVTALKR